MTHPSPQHIAIAGAGLLGRLLAWQLLKRGHKVSLYEAGLLESPSAAAWTAAGMISPLSEAVVSDYTIYKMGIFALAQWPRWLAQLGDRERAQALFSHRGSLLVAHPQDHSELEQFARDLAYVLPEQHGYRTVYAREIRALEPDLGSQFQQGLLLEDEGHIDNRKLLQLLLSEIQQLGGACHERCSVELAPGQVMLAGGNKTYDLVIDCRGMGAKPQEPKLRGVRGETLHVHTTEVKLERPVRLMHPRYQLYIVPKPRNCFIIGATQIESEDLSPVSLQSSLELGSALYTLSPAFAEARILEQGVNLRPAFIDNMPHIQMVDGLIAANGLFRHGYLLAPAVVCHILAHLDKVQDIPFADFFKPLNTQNP